MAKEEKALQRKAQVQSQLIEDPLEEFCQGHETGRNPHFAPFPIM